MADKQTKEMPTQQEIDSLLGLYADAEKNLATAREIRGMYGEQIEEMIKAHGFMPPRATKSKRIQGAEWKATLSQGKSVEVDGTWARQLRLCLKRIGRVRLFRKLFRPEVVYVLADGSQQALAAMQDINGGPLTAEQHRELVRLYNLAVIVDDNSPSLKVEPLKDEKPAKKEGKAA
jgi:hypothetical protein